MNGPEAKPDMEKKCPQCGATLPTGALEGLCPACLLKQGATAETAAPSDFPPFQPPTLEEVAKAFPQLEIIALIGRGGMGAVYKARQPALDRYVALKILPPQVAAGPGFADRFNREARALARLSHPNIVAVHEFGQANGLPFLIMEFVDGLNLRQLERAGKLSPREALQIVPQICEALQFAHDEGIVHRDIKPENILLDKKGRVKIADFGIAKIIGREAEIGLTETGGSVGTPQYMAPEQAEKPESVDHRADIFSLGVVFYEMLTGELPLGKFSPPSGKVKVDVRLDEVVLRALEKEPERRYQHASQVKTAVNNIASTAGPLNAGESEALAQELLSRDYVLDIGSCLRRGWALVCSDFWPIIGVTAILILLVQAAYSTAVGIVAGAPLMGGLWLYLLKRARGESSGIDTAFSGFHLAFVQLFLAGLVTKMLTLVGFVCFILPGLYLLVAWMFTLQLVIDKRLDFWTAMGVSRRMVTRHWFKMFLFWLVLAIMNFAGLLLCGVGIFLTTPIALAAVVFAYEDIFGAADKNARSPAAAQFGPSGTVVTPAAPSGTVAFGSGAGKVIAVGLAILVFITGLIAIFGHFGSRARNRRVQWSAPRAVYDAPVVANVPLNYGPVIERVLEFSNPDRRAINLASGNFVNSTPSHPIDFGPDALNTLRTAHVDLYLSDATLAFLTNQSAGTESPVLRIDALDIRELGNLRSDSGDEVTDLASAEYNAMNRLFEARETNGSPSEQLNDTNIFTFTTRDGAEALVQLAGISEIPPGIKLRYKLVTRAPDSPRNPRSNKLTRRALSDRIEAAASIVSSEERSSAFARIVHDAASVGEADIVKQSLPRILSSDARDQAAFDAARTLGSLNLRKQGIEVARSILSSEMRDQALAELAR